MDVLDVTIEVMDNVSFSDSLSSEKYILRIEDGGRNLLLFAAGDPANMTNLDFAALDADQVETLVAHLQLWLRHDKKRAERTSRIINRDL